MGLLVWVVVYAIVYMAWPAQRRATENFRQAVSVAEDVIFHLDHLVPENQLVILDDERVKNIPGFDRMQMSLVNMALSHLEKLVGQSKEDPSAEAALYTGLGLIQLTQGKFGDAVATFQKQVEIMPRHKEAWHFMGEALRRQGKLEEAVASYRKQLQVKPNHEGASFNMAVALYTLDDWDNAIQAFQKHTQVTPEHTHAWAILGVILWKQGNNDAAASAFAQGLAVRPTDLALLSNDAELALAQGDKTRLQSRIAAASSQVTPKGQEFVILPFLSWLANPMLGWGKLMKAIDELAPEVEITWDFSDTARALEQMDLDATTQQTARRFIDFFERWIDLPALKAHLVAE